MGERAKIVGAKISKHAGVQRARGYRRRPPTAGRKFNLNERPTDITRNKTGRNKDSIKAAKKSIAGDAERLEQQVDS